MCEIIKLQKLFFICNVINIKFYPLLIYHKHAEERPTEFSLQKKLFLSNAQQAVLSEGNHIGTLLFQFTDEYLINIQANEFNRIYK